MLLKRNVLWAILEHKKTVLRDSVEGKEQRRSDQPPEERVHFAASSLPPIVPLLSMESATSIQPHFPLLNRQLREQWRRPFKCDIHKIFGFLDRWTPFPLPAF